MEQLSRQQVVSLVAHHWVERPVPPAAQDDERSGMSPGMSPGMSSERAFEVLRAERDEARRQLADALGELDAVRSQLIEARFRANASGRVDAVRPQQPSDGSHLSGRRAGLSTHERWCVPAAFCCCDDR